MLQTSANFSYYVLKCAEKCIRTLSHFPWLSSLGHGLRPGLGFSNLLQLSEVRGEPGSGAGFRGKLFPL